MEMLGLEGLCMMKFDGILPDDSHESIIQKSPFLKRGDIYVIGENEFNEIYKKSEIGYATYYNKVGFKDSYIFTENKDYEGLKSVKTNISQSLIEKMIKDEDFYNFILNSEEKKFILTCVSNSSLMVYQNGINIDIVRYVDILRQLIERNMISINPNEMERFLKLKSKYVKKNFYDYLNNEWESIKDISIDKENVTIDKNLIIKLLNLNDADLEKAINDGYFEGIDLRKIAFMLFCIVKKYDSNEYPISKELAERINMILLNDKIDYYSINKCNKTTMPGDDVITLSDDLKTTILSSVPSEYDDLKKSIYIYIKLCKVITYDDEFYAMNQSGKVADKQMKFSYISQVNSDNNKVVCYTFSAIFAKLLDEIGIKSNVSYESLFAMISGSNDVFNNQHHNMIYRVGDYIIKADAVTGILMGDIASAKINGKIDGLQCENPSKITSEKFLKSFNEVYDDIKKNENRTFESFEETVKKYEKLKLKSEDNKISFDDKISIMIRLLAKSNMKGIDSMSYILMLKKLLFTEQEKCENFVPVFIRENIENEEIEAKTIAVFAINKSNYNDDPDNNAYLVYVPCEKIERVTYDELKERFIDGKYSYIDRNILIPGIERNVRK